MIKIISVNNKIVNLDLNSRGVSNTGLFFKQHDNKVATLEFNVSLDEVEIDYSNIEKVLLIIYFQDGTALDPMLCDVGDSSITKLVTNCMLSKVGTVDGILRIYSTDNQILTTNSFRFTVDKDVFKDKVIDEEISLLNQAMEKFMEHEQNENTRQSNESSRNTNEVIRENAENARIAKENARQIGESDRNTNEISRMNAEQSRVDAETDRQSTINTLVSDVNTLKTQVQDLTDQLNTLQEGMS